MDCARKLCPLSFQQILSAKGSRSQFSGPLSFKRATLFRSLTQASNGLTYPPPDAVEFDPLTDCVAIGGGAGLLERQHFGGQHLQLQRHRQPIARAAHADAEEDLARHEHFARGAALQPIEIRQPLGIGLVGPGEPEALQFLLARGIPDLRDRLDPVADGVSFMPKSA